MGTITAVAGLLAAGLSVADTVPYLRDTLRRSTVPHRGTWLVWSVLGLIAVESQRAGGARWSLVPLVVQAAGTIVVLALSVRLGSGGMSAADLVMLAVAATGVAGWVALDEPVLATGCVVVADLMAALMMVPKTWARPHSETQSTFVLAAMSGLLAMCSVGSASFALLLYPVYFTMVNVGLASIIASRRRRLRLTTVAQTAQVVGRETVGAEA